jgi:hypothetical protein
MIFYNSAKKKFLDGDIDLLADTIKVMLLDSGYTPNIDTDEFKDDVDGDQISGTGYTAGGQALASKVTTVNTSSDNVKFDAADTVWTTATFTARYAVIYKDTGVAGTSALIAYIDFGTDKSAAGSDFEIEWNSAGIFTLS